MKLHGNARLTPRGRKLLVERVCDQHVSLQTAALAAGVSTRTASKWVARYRREGELGLLDRSSVPHRVPRRTPAARVSAIEALRRLRMTAAEIAELLGMARSTVSAVLLRIGLGKRSRLDPLEPPNRYERARPGELLHIDVKKLGRIHGGAGKRMRDGLHRHSTPRRTNAEGRERKTVGWEYVHVCVDDATRLAYVEVLADEKGHTAAVFLRRAVAFYARHGIAVERVMTDNGSPYISIVHALACRALGLRHLRTRPYRPRTNGKAERFIRTLLDGWAYGAIYATSAERTRALTGWLDHYNRRRPHLSLNHQPPRADEEQRSWVLHLGACPLGYGAVCGICGLFSPRGRLESPERQIGAMVAALAHRGPDASGVHVDDRVAIGSTRLAIIDLLGGDPPIYSEDRSVCLVYNGEIYDHQQIRRRLERRGHVFASDTDSEVVVHAYEEDGIESVGAFNGMFAFAIWDAARSTLHLARDRFGQKPLYYHWNGTALVFASEINALLASGRVTAALDLDAMVEALTFQNIVSTRSIVRDVSMLPPGSVLTVDEHGHTLTRYFDPMPKPDEAIDAREAPGLVEHAFRRAVERHLMSDVEVASYLSGGLDTGSIAAIASESLPRLSTFCIGFDVSTAVGLEAGFDELDDARVLAEKLGTHHHDLRLDASDMEMVLPRMMRHLEEPRMNFSYPNYLAAGLTSRWVKVVLSGAGGDELFGGYPWRYAHGDGDDFPNSYFRYWNRLLTPDELREALLPHVLAQIDIGRPREVFDEVMEQGEGLPNLDRILYYESRTYLHGLLVLEDKLSMAHSLESRVPFLDHELVDLALALPAEQKVWGIRSKELFRLAVADILPAAVASRGKTGFTPPQAAWFRGPQAGYVRKILTERAAAREIFRPAFINRVLTEHETGVRDRHHLIWTLLCLEWWHRIFIEREHAK